MLLYQVQLELTFKFLEGIFPFLLQSNQILKFFYVLQVHHLFFIQQDLQVNQINLLLFDEVLLWFNLLLTYQDSQKQIGCMILNIYKCKKKKYKSPLYKKEFFIRFSK